MLKEVLLGEAVGRLLTGDKVLAICEESGEFCNLKDIIQGFRFLTEDVPPVVEEAVEDVQEDEEEPVEEDMEDLPPCPLDDEEYVRELSQGKKIDHGRIVALYQASPRRSIRWIADDVGCSQQTVINHLVREGIYEPKRKEK